LTVGSYPQETQRTYTTADGLPADDVRDLIVVSDGTVWLQTSAGSGCWDGEKWAPGPRPAAPRETADFVWQSCGAGLEVRDPGGSTHPLTPAHGLPLETITHVATAPEGTQWLGTPQGVIRWRNGKWKYFAGRRWLPDEEVQALAAAPDGSAWVGTKAGLVHLYTEEMTLAEKAARFEERIAQRHKRHGYVTSCHLEEPGAVDRFIHEASDNDGLWTALYVAAQSYQYAATGDPAARERARESLYALLWLEEVSTVDGFPARAAVKKGERVIKSGGEWHDSADGAWEWKGDTSSDEVDGHFYAFSVYYDLVADEPDQAALRRTAHRIMTHILDHDLLLVDLDGEHTRWGVWGPQFLNGPWREQQGLNSLEILAHLRTAYHLTGEPRFAAAYRDLVENHHYALNTLNQKLIPPDEVNHSDDELAFISYYPLLKYETDPALRAIYLLSLERTWRIERPERNPLWNFIYGALTGNPCDVEASVRTLQEIPLDLINWPLRNSHRLDVRIDEERGRFGEVQAAEPLPPDERAVMKWNGNPYRLDGGGDGRSEDDGTFFLLPYWMGRYYGFMREEGSTTFSLDTRLAR